MGTFCCFSGNASLGADGNIYVSAPEVREKKRLKKQGEIDETVFIWNFALNLTNFKNLANWLEAEIINIQNYNNKNSFHFTAGADDSRGDTYVSARDVRKEKKRARKGIKY